LLSEKLSKKANELEQRISIIEEGLIFDYGTVVSALFSLSDQLTSVLSNDRRKKYLKSWHDQTDYLNKMYETVDFDKVIVNQDTAPFFVCKQLYNQQLKSLTDQFSKELDEGCPNVDTAKQIQRISLMIVDVGRLVPFGDILSELNKIQGYENSKRGGIWVSHKCCTNLDYKI
jgi:hypothetical protein